MQFLYVFLDNICIGSEIVFVIIITLLPFNCIVDLVIHHLIRIILIICKYINTSAVKMLQYRRRTACASALTVFALTNNILAVTEGFVDILGKLWCFGKEAFIGIFLFRQIIEVKIIHFAIEHIIASCAVIDSGIVFVNMFQLWITKADNSSIIRE